MEANSISQVWISRDAWKVESRKIEKGERERGGKNCYFLERNLEKRFASKKYLFANTFPWNNFFISVSTVSSVSSSVYDVGNRGGSD